MAGANSEIEQHLSNHAIWVAWDCKANLSSETEIRGFLAELRREFGGDPQLPAAVYWDKIIPINFTGINGQSLNQYPRLHILTFPEQLSVYGDISFPQPDEQQSPVKIPVHQIKRLVTDKFSAGRVEVERNFLSRFPQGLMERLTRWDNE